MEVDKKEAWLLQQAIKEWESDNLITTEQAERLRSSYQLRTTDWQTITLYIFIAAVSSALMAFGALVLDEKWIEIIRKRLSLTDGIIAVIFTALSLLLCIQGYRRRQRQPVFSFNRELFWLLPILSIGVAVVYLGKSVQYLQGNFGIFWFIASLAFGMIGAIIPSRLLWISMLLCLIPAYVVSTYHFTGDSYFLGMNLPSRMVPLAIIILGIHWVARNIPAYRPVRDITWVGGWLLLLLSAWLVSIFGNTATWDQWQQVRQVQLLWWVGIFTALCVATLWLGISTRDNFVRDVSVIFLLLDGYTRYFEYLWDRTNKGIFFFILAVSFWWLGKWIEKRKAKSKLPPPPATS